MRRWVLAAAFVLAPVFGWAQQPGIQFQGSSSIANVTCIAGTSCTFTAPILLPDGTVSDPAIQWPSDVQGANKAGFYRPQAGSVAYAYNGVQWVRLGTTGVILNTGTFFGWGSDLFLSRDAANTLALRNTTNAQTFNIYNTADGSPGSNYERATLQWDTNEFTISTNIGGTGTLRIMNVFAGSHLVLGAGTAGRWTIRSSGELRPTLPDAYIIGASTHSISEAYVSRAVMGSKTKALTETTPTTVFTIALADKAVTMGTIKWAVHAADATNTQMIGNDETFTCVNEADTEACVSTDVAGDVDNTPTGTLTCTDAWSYGTNTASWTLDCTSSLTQTTLNAYVRLDLLVPQTVTFP